MGNTTTQGPGERAAVATAPDVGPPLGPVARRAAGDATVGTAAGADRAARAAGGVPPGLTRDAWLRRLESDPGATFHLHPDLVLSPHAGYDNPVVIACGPDGEPPAEAPALVAVLAPKRVVFKPLPGVPLRLALRGHRLVGNHVVGADSAERVAPILREFGRLVTSGRSDCVLFEDLDAESPLYRELTKPRGGPRRAKVVVPSAPQPHWWVEFPDDPSDYWGKFSKKTRYNIRSAAKKLEHDVVRCSTPADVPAFVSAAHEVSLRSWQAKRLGVRVRNTPEEVRHLEALARLGVLRSYLLQHQGRPVAFVIGMQWNRCYTYEEIGYDLEFTERSPGTVLLFRLLEDLIASDTPRRVDFGYGDADYKRVFGTGQTLSGPAMLVRRGWRPMAVVWADAGGRAAAGWLRGRLDNLHVLSKVRRLYRR